MSIAVRNRQRRMRTKNISGRRRGPRPGQTVTIIQRPPRVRSTENKWYDYTTQSKAVANTWTLMDAVGSTPVNAIPQGNGDSQRDGRQCKMLSLHCKILLTSEWWSETANTFLENEGPQVVRIIAVLDKIPSSTTSPPIANIFQSGGAIPASGTMQFRNLQYTNKYQIIFDRQISVTRLFGVDAGQSGNPRTWTSPETHKVVTINKRFKKPLMLEFLGASSSYANMQKNAITFFAAKVTTGGRTFCQINARTRFMEY
jgi:hypothetical protein